MNDAAHKVAEVVRQLSNISRTTFVTQQELDVNAAIQELMKRIAGRVPRGVVVQTSFDPELQKISADQGQLDQILFSLISNALEACDAKGTITIETNNATLEPSEGYKSMRHFVSVTVRDTGHGIPKDELPQIFEPFFTTRKDAGHAGLGLAISQGLIRDYHGFLDVTSQVGVGTEVRFGLPAIQADPFAYLDDAYRTVKQKSILLVEDDHAVRLLLRKILERNKYSILEARDGEEALFVADLHRGNIDLMVTDVHMPRVTGPELVRQFAPLHPETKYLLISGFSPSKIQASSLPPDVRFLQKPFDQKSLLLHIRGLLEIDTN
jgi:two-component system cell cycle sensor histidine kinase/response regulator CckA